MLHSIEQDHFQEFSAHVGPHGSGYVMSKSTFRRMLWMSIMGLGIIGSSICLIKCLSLYRSYPSNIKISINEDPVIKFPHIVLCLNSLHSKNNVERYYPHFSNLMGLLYNGITINETFLNETILLRNQGYNRSYIGQYIDHHIGTLGR